MPIPDDKSTNRYGFHSAPTEKEVINAELVLRQVVSRVAKLLDSTSKASSLKKSPSNEAAVDTLRACILACNAAIKAPSEDMNKPLPVHESRNSFGR